MTSGLKDSLFPPADGDAAMGAAAGDLLSDLNAAQREAVLHEEGPLLILAGAGSGKTRAVTTRIARLVLEGRARPSEILAITFTNKAAREMRQRVARWMDPRGAWITTFHSACARILRHDIEALPGYGRDFTIWDTSDRNRVLKELVKRAGYDPKRFKPAMIGAEISRWKNEARSVSLQDGELVLDSEAGMDDEVFVRVRAAYAEALRASNALDFDDLLLKVLELFERQPGLRDAWSSRFRYVLVDEYQDTNRVQYLLLRHLSGFHGNPAVCGDPDQSIYAWRGADLRNILDFERDFPGARVVRLERNYRSTKTILAAAQAVIGHNQERKQKDLWSEGQEGARIEITECGTEDDEALEIAHRIRMLAARGRGFDQMAVFYRANFMQRALEQQLARMQIPHEIVSGTAFYERREIKDLVAWLRLLVNPADAEAFRRAAGAPARGIGERTLERLTELARERGLGLLAAAESEEARARIRGRARSALAGLCELCQRLAPLRQAPAGQAVETVLEETGYMRWLASLEGDEVDREENVQELLARAQTFDRDRPEATLRDFLEDVALVSDADGYEEGRGSVSLMTLHTAKGLEFPVVFLTGLEEDLLPHARSIGTDGWGGQVDRGVEEERRLFYVGMTRAKELLVITHAQRRRHFGQESWSRPSRFLDEIPPELVEGFEGETRQDESSVLGEYVPEEGVDLQEGDRVLHSSFGYGVVERLLGRGANARATVCFEHAGTKQLLLAYARLERVGRPT